MIDIVVVAHCNFREKINSLLKGINFKFLSSESISEIDSKKTDTKPICFVDVFEKYDRKELEIILERLEWINVQFSKTEFIPKKG